MIRKQVYLLQAQNRKLKALAAMRGCTEAEVIRDALDRLPDPAPAGSVRAQLEAAGFLATMHFGDDVPTGEKLADLEAEVEAWLNALPEPLGLSDAVLAERDESPY